ncbi:hypothetical protein RSAG8_04606, partial [Rhizoctonia solani AG-8 WAC10335]
MDVVRIHGNGIHDGSHQQAVCGFGSPVGAHCPIDTVTMTRMIFGPNYLISIARLCRIETEPAVQPFRVFQSHLSRHRVRVGRR